MVRSPASAHATKSHPGAPTSRVDSADVMKMPDPIIEPTTIIVASSSPSPRSKCSGCRSASRLAGESSLISTDIGVSANRCGLQWRRML
jgi:hypothetical protein